MSPVCIITLHLFLVLKASDKNEEDDDDSGPSWDMQESMVRKLQKKFPDQDKEVNGTLAACNSSKCFKLTLLLSGLIYR